MCTGGQMPRIASAPALLDLRHRVRFDGAALEATSHSLTTLVLTSAEPLSEQDCKQLFRCSLLTKLTARGALPVQCLQQLPGALRNLTQLQCAVGTTSDAAVAVATHIALALPQLVSLRLPLRLDENDFAAQYQRLADERVALHQRAASSAAAVAAASEAKGDAKLQPVTLPRMRTLYLGACDDSLFQRCRFPALEELSFSGEGVRIDNWAAVSAACPRVRRLDLTDLPGVDDKAVCAVLHGLRESLQQLSFYDLPQVSGWLLLNPLIIALVRRAVCWPTPLLCFQVGAGTLQFLMGTETALPLLRTLDVLGPGPRSRQGRVRTGACACARSMLAAHSRLCLH
jgi:hypothetical protein